MSGVLKDILLVFASMFMFHDPVTGQQFFGYSIALAGLTYYKLGADNLKSLATDARLRFGEFRHKNPARTKLIGILGIFGLIAWACLLWGPTAGGEYAKYVRTTAPAPAPKAP